MANVQSTGTESRPPGSERGSVPGPSGENRTGRAEALRDAPTPPTAVKTGPRDILSIFIRRIFGLGVRKNGGLTIVYVTVDDPVGTYEPDVTFDPTELYLRRGDTVTFEVLHKDSWEIEFFADSPFEDGAKFFGPGGKGKIKDVGSDPRVFPGFPYRLNEYGARGTSKKVNWHNCPEIIIQR